MSFLAKFSGTQSIRLPDEEQQQQQLEDTQPAAPGIFTKVRGVFGGSSSPALPEPPMEDPPESSIELSRWDRLMLFAVCFAGSASCFIVCFMLLPVLALKPRKFAVLSSIGSMLFLCSFGFLQGFRHYLSHLFSKERLWFTVCFVLSIAFALVGSMYLHSTLISLIAVVVQLLNMLAYTISYFPMGRTGLRLASNVAISQVDNWLST